MGYIDLFLEEMDRSKREAAEKALAAKTFDELKPDERAMVSGVIAKLRNKATVEGLNQDNVVKEATKL